MDLDRRGLHRSRRSVYKIDDDDDDDDGMEEMDPDREGPLAVVAAPQLAGNVKWLMTSKDFGVNWTWAKFPTQLQPSSLSVDPTNSSSLYAVADNCLAHSTDNGLSWSECSKSSGLTGTLSKLIIKTSQVMFMIRGREVPLRTNDAGATWQALSACEELFKYGATFQGSLSWSGNTLVLSGTDLGAVSRGEYGTKVWKSVNDGDDWTDETGDLVTISTGPGVWFEKDFYFVTQGEGVTVKRNFEA